MIEIPKWDETVVIPIHNKACVPAAYEWMVRYLQLQDINLDSFQNDYDLGEKSNNFTSVGKKIMETYPITVNVKTFEKFEDKISIITKLLNQGTPCVMPVITLIDGESVDEWHAVIVVAIGKIEIKTIERGLISNGKKKNFTDNYSIAEIEEMHGYKNQGKDLVWIEK